MEKWIKAGVAFNFISAVIAIWAQFFPHSTSQQGGIQVGHYLPSSIALLSSVVLVFGILIYRDKWPFNRKKKPPETERKDKPPEMSENIILSPYPLTLVNVPKYEHADPSSTAVYKDKVRFVVNNSYDQNVEVWSPLWESTEVPIQPPLGALLRKEGKDGLGPEERCVTLSPYEKAHGWIGLVQPTIGDGLEVRLAHRSTGYLVFPLKVNGKMRYARLQI